MQQSLRGNHIDFFTIISLFFEPLFMKWFVYHKEITFFFLHLYESNSTDDYYNAHLTTLFPSKLLISTEVKIIIYMKWLICLNDKLSNVSNVYDCFYSDLQQKDIDIAWVTFHLKIIRKVFLLILFFNCSDY